LTISTLVGLLFALYIALAGAVGDIVTIMMGMTSVITLMMRNSPEVKPKYSWM
tara:strand:- start:11546 stop:11704 length:159 start_codon:yes stop_codon:yes gene_type:complete